MGLPGSQIRPVSVCIRLVPKAHRFQVEPVWTPRWAMWGASTLPIEAETEGEAVLDQLGTKNRTPETPHKELTKTHT